MKKEDQRYRFVRKMLEGAGRAVQLSVEETTRFRREWRTAFIPDKEREGISLHGCSNCTGRYNSFDWHYYSFNRFLAEKDPVGKMEVCSHPRERAVVWIELCSMPAAELSVEELARFLRENGPPRDELYIAPRKLSWTAIYTHEDDFGPYFAERTTRR